MSEMAGVGVLGLGKMGSAFATNLLSKRNEVHVYNRSKDRLRGLIAKGAVAHPSPIELGKSVDVVITSLPDQDVVEKNREFLNQVGSTVFYRAKPGSGHKMKLMLNLFLGTISLAFSESFVLSQRLGFEPRAFVDAFNKTPHKNDCSDVKGPLIAKGDYTPLFTVNMPLKDLTLAENQATRQKVALLAGSLAKQLFTTGVNQGQGEMDFSSIAVTLQQLNGIPPPA